MNIHEKETGMNNSHAFNDEGPLLFTPKAMDSLSKSIDVLMYDINVFTNGTMNYYRYLCYICANNILARIGVLRHAGNTIAGLRPKSSEPYADFMRDIVENCYSDIDTFHILICALYDIYNNRTCAQLDELAKLLLRVTFQYIIKFAGVTEWFLDAYQVPEDFLPFLPLAHRTVFYCYAKDVEKRYENEPEMVEAWRERLNMDFEAVHEAFIAEHSSRTAVNLIVA